MPPRITPPPGPGRRPASTPPGGRPQPAGSPAPPAAPLIAPTGSASLDALAQTVNRTAQPFQQAPPPHQGAVGQVSNALNATLGLVNAPFELLDTGLAMATAGIAQFFPAFPAAPLMALHIGVPHAHSHPPSLIPPAPPVPLPSIGPVMASGCVSVLINGIPAARCGDVGLSVTCGSLAPPFEVATGSSQVFIGGSRAARLLDITRHCNPSSMGAFTKALAVAGMAASALGAVTQAMDSSHSSAEAAAAESAAEAENLAAMASAQAMAAAMTAAQTAADAAAFAMALLCGKDPGIPPGMGAITMGSPNVLIGGFPMPNSLEVLNGLMRAARGLARGVRGGRRRGRLFCMRCM